MSAPLLHRLVPDDAARAAPAATDRATRAAAAEIVDDVRARGEDALREHAARLDGLAAGAPLALDRDDLLRARDALDSAARALLERAAERVRRFALSQREALADAETEVPGGRAGHAVAPVAAAGCYAPGGRHPLPSSVLMTAVTARAAGVGTVWVASPRPAPVALAAAAVAGADGVLCAGGAQAVAALAFGVVAPRCDLVVGPGNRWVTAAKEHVFGAVGIDLPAGPSELVVVADGTASPELVAADLLAQAEHDPDARPLLVASDEALVARVEAELGEQLATLPTADVARRALAGGGAFVAASRAEAARIVDALAPEHLQLSCADPDAFLGTVSHYGGAFLGEGSAEVLGDYGAGPNHVLPTGGAARFSGGLSVLTFLRVRTWLAIDDPRELARDAAALARLEGLEAHARAAEARR